MGETLTFKAPVGPEARRYVRRWARNEVNIPAKIEILTAKLKKSTLPAANFRVRLTFSSAKYKGIGAICRPIRFGRGDEFQLAVEFEDFWAKAGSK